MISRAIWLTLLLALIASSSIEAHAAPQAKPKEAEKPQEATIEISGHALDESGNPIAGARIYLVSTNGVEKDLGQTLTNAEGEYVFRGVRLPIMHDPAPGAIPGGTFQLYGEAKGYGFAWHGMRFYRPTPRTAKDDKTARNDTYFQDDSIEIDLSFAPEAMLSGTVKNEKGAPIAGATLTLSSMDYLKTEDKEFHPNFREFWAQRRAPAHFHTVKSDNEGKFTFNGLPAETVGYARINHPDYAGQSFHAAVTSNPIDSYEFISNSSSTVINGVQVQKPIWETRKVRSGPLEVKLVSTRSIKVQIIGNDNNAPAAKVSISAVAENGVSVHGTTDKEGRVLLKAPPDDYRIVLDPQPDSGYVRTELELLVADKPGEQSTQFRLTKGCVVEFETIDDATGTPIKGVSFSAEYTKKIARDGQLQEIIYHMGVQSVPWIVDYPLTDKNGKLRAVVDPGKHKFKANSTKEYQGDLGGVEVDCESGKTIDVQFKLKKK